MVEILNCNLLYLRLHSSAQETARCVSGGKAWQPVQCCFRCAQSDTGPNHGAWIRSLSGVFL